VEGRVAEILVDEGYPLERGQVMLRLETEAPELEVQRAEAEVREARAELDLQNLTLHRQATLLEEGVIPQQVFDDALARKKLAEARFEQARAVLRLAKKRLRDTTVKSPLAGVVTERHVAVGEYVHAGTALFTAVSTDPLKLHFTLPERFAGRVRRGQAVTARVKAYSEREFCGEIYFISAQVDPDTRALQIKARVANPEGFLKPGFFADVRLIIGVNEEGVILPQEAVVLRDGRAVAYVVEKGVARERTVRTGEQFDGRVEILAGIAPDELVVTSGNYVLTDGESVTVVDTERAATAPPAG
jgi:membrane fusion protein (multidrug efflux system)